MESSTIQALLTIWPGRNSSEPNASQRKTIESTTRPAVLEPPAGAVPPFRGRLPCSLPSRKPIGAQLARRAFSAAVAPVVANRAVAQIAAVGFLDQKSHEPLPAELMRKVECCRLVDPHQRRMDHEAPLHAEIE